MLYSILKPTNQRFNTQEIYGFDIETYDLNKKLYCLSVWSDDYKRLYFTKEDFIDDLKSGRFNHCIIVATNLSFDFMGVFFGEKDIKHFDFIFRGSELIFSKTYFYNGTFHKRSGGQSRRGITFLDTMNYARMSVSKLGEIIGLQKLHKPFFLGYRPFTKRQKDTLIVYNLRDSEIACKGLKFLYKSFEDLGATPKLTISSTAMSLFRNRYLKHDYFRHPKNYLRDIFKGYYGGRTEAFCRGYIEKYDYYDFNSLYPAKMEEHEYPDPNTVRRITMCSMSYIRKYEGMSLVSVTSPDTMYPFLPYRTETKLTFPVGKFRGYYTHVELRHALTLGYKIRKIHKTYYYKSNCRPFVNFVKDMYALRLRFKKENNPMELVVKLIMNSLSGKFGQKFDDKQNLVPLNHSARELSRIKKFDIIGDFLRIVEDVEPTCFCIPIWISYVTSYGRISLHGAIVKSNAIYCDTDSIITKKKLPFSDRLGDLDREFKVKTGYIVKPKFYSLNGKSKIKGVGIKLVFDDFLKLLYDPGKKIEYKKFLKFKESLRRGLTPNLIIPMAKHLDLEDTKRVWKHKFNPREFQRSRPLKISTEKVI